MKKGCVIGLVVGLVLLVVFIILMALSFVGVHYYQYGFLKSISTGEVFPTPVYEGGLYGIGPNRAFLTFPADAHYVSLSELSVATADENSITLWVSFQYRLRKDEVNYLREKYNLGYEAIIQSTATEAIKQTTTSFTNREFLRDREGVEETLAAAIRDKLESRCCSESCMTNDSCTPDCLQPDSCTEADRRMNVEVLDVQLTDIDLLDDLRNKYLTTILLGVEQEKTKLNTNVTIIQKETDVQVNKINIESKEIRSNASAQASLVRAQAEADARELVESARIQGLVELFRAVGIDDDDDKKAINYLRALKGMDQARLNVAFQSLFRQN